MGSGWGTEGAQEIMNDGEVVQVEINDIGVLRSPVGKER
jgi:hypothetical protein